MNEPVLRMEGVTVALTRRGRQVPVVEELSLSIAAGEMLAIVGESGSGKTMAALSIPRLLPEGATVSGQTRLCGQALTGLGEAEMRRVRGARIGMVFQDPLAAFNPSHSIGAQIAEPIRLHLGASRQAAWARAVALLEEVGIADPAARARDYPHQFSGGMRQRAMIAVAVACRPDLLIADEPTTGLDAVLKREVLDLLARLRVQRQMAVLFVSHDLASVRRHADAVHVLYAGRTMERGPARAVFGAPRHPYTIALLQAGAVLGQAPAPIPGMLPEPEARPPGCRFAPRCGRVQEGCRTIVPPLGNGDTEAACLFPVADPVLALAPAPKPFAVGRHAPLLQLDRVTVRYRKGGFGSVDPEFALEAATLSLAAGECLALVGASGSGKTSLGRATVQIVPYEGRVLLGGTALGSLRGAAKRAACRRLGMVFQDPAGSLNPAMTVAELIGEAIRLGGERRSHVVERRIGALLQSVGLPPALGAQSPASLSGGQAQRVAFARALAAEPDVLVLDEPTSGLDVSSQAVLLNLLRRLITEHGLSCMIITHDLAAVAFMVHRFAVVYRGRIVEVAAADAFLRAPQHPHSLSLVAAAQIS